MHISIVEFKFVNMYVRQSSVVFSVSQPAQCSITHSTLDSEIDNEYSAVIKPNMKYVIKCSMMDIDKLRSISYSFTTEQSTSSIVFGWLKYILFIGIVVGGGFACYSYRSTIMYCITLVFVSNRDITEQIKTNLTEQSTSSSMVEEVGLLKTTVSESSPQTDTIDISNWRCVSCKNADLLLL